MLILGCVAMGAVLTMAFLWAWHRARRLQEDVETLNERIALALEEKAHNETMLSELNAKYEQKTLESLDLKQIAIREQEAMIRDHFLDRRKVEFSGFVMMAGWLRHRDSAT